jgi:hypothetical protein
MHFHSIMMLLGWPLLILVSWYAVRFALNIFERNRKYPEKEEAK